MFCPLHAVEWPENAGVPQEPPWLWSELCDGLRRISGYTLTDEDTYETLFRLGIAAQLISQSAFIFVALALFDLLKGVNLRLAVLMVTLIVVSIPIAFLNELNAIAALVLVRGADFLSMLEKPQRDALAMLFLDLHGHGFDVCEIFWGLWLFPLGLLVYRSGFLPRILGVLLMVACVGWLVNSLTSLVLPQYEDIVSRWMMPATLGELLFMFWLLIIGANPKPFAARSPH